MKPKFCVWGVLRVAALLALICARPIAAQSNGSVVGRVIDAQSKQPLSGVDVRIVSLPHRTVTNAEGRFVIGAVPPGEREVRAELIGHKPVVVERVQVRAGGSTELRIEMQTAPVALPGVVVQADRVRLIEPEVSTTHEVVVAREIRELPIDRLAEIIELTTGVSEGHFRGGRVGQEVYVVDGLSLKNQFEASSVGFGLELSPSSLEEVDVITGGFGAAYGSALSGVVSYSTRRGNPERWEKRASFTTDYWAPAPIFRGFTGLSLSAGGPLSFLGKGTTLFADFLAQGYLDADTRAAGLTCVQQDIAESALAGAIQNLQSTPNAEGLLCPYTSEAFPHQQGDKYIAFARLDRPLGPSVNLTTSFLRNRFQRQLYTSEFKYNPTYQLGQRTEGTLANISAEWLKQKAASARSIIGRVALLRLDRYLGAVDPASMEGGDIAGFRPAGLEFLGEDFVRRPIDEQLQSGEAVPGYITPGGSVGSPFGPAGEGIFFTTGTPVLANWTRSDLLSLDLSGSYFHPSGSTFRAGGAAKLYRVETYERAFANLAGSIPNYARFFPGNYSGFAEADIETIDGMHFQLGVRFDAFRSGINFLRDRADFLAAAIETGWKLSILPRVGAAFPIPGTQERTAVHFNFGRVAQPPDFQYFLDSTIGDSLRTDVRRQGNPNLAFEKGSSYEVGGSHLFNEHFSGTFTLFQKRLDNLVTGSLAPGDLGQEGTFTTDDFGHVKGAEVSLRGRWPGFTARAGWSIQKATGVSSGLDSDSTQTNDNPAVTEYPLAFDRRHSIDVALFLGRAGGAETPWSAAVTGSAQSGYPLFPIPSAATAVREPNQYLPWTWTADLRASWDFGAMKWCAGCRWRAVADGRNVFNRKNVLALRRENAALTPSLAEVQRLANAAPNLQNPIPRESPSYSRLIDLNRDGLITNDEFRTARFAAALDRFDPSLYYGEARQVRLGVEVVF